MQEVIRDYLEQAKVGRKQVHKNMTIFPLLSDYSLSLDYILLDEALGGGVIEVTEVDNHGAVPNLKVHNKSPSMAMAGIYEKDLPSLQEYLSHFTLVGSQVGAVFMINGKVGGADAFGKPETFSKTFKKLVESYAMDAIDWLEEGERGQVFEKRSDPIY